MFSYLHQGLFNKLFQYNEQWFRTHNLRANVSSTWVSFSRRWEIRKDKTNAPLEFPHHLWAFRRHPRHDRWVFVGHCL